MNKFSGSPLWSLTWMLSCLFFGAISIGFLVQDLRILSEDKASGILWPIAWALIALGYLVTGIFHGVEFSERARNESEHIR